MSCHHRPTQRGSPRRLNMQDEILRPDPQRAARRTMALGQREPFLRVCRFAPVPFLLPGLDLVGETPAFPTSAGPRYPLLLARWTHDRAVSGLTPWFLAILATGSGIPSLMFF